MINLFQIPISRTVEDASFFELQANLDGNVFTLEFRWNDREQAWYMTLWDEDRQIGYAAGMKLVANWYLRRYHTDRTPPGDFILIDTAAPFDKGIDPGFDDLGNRHLLFYRGLNT